MTANPPLQLNASYPQAAAPALAAANMSLPLPAAAAWLDAAIGGSQEVAVPLNATHNTTMW